MTENRFSALPREVWVAAGLLFGYVAFVCWDQMFYWETHEDFSFGYLVPFFVGYVLYERWPKIKTTLIDGGKADGVTSGWVTAICSLVAWGAWGVSLLFLVFGGMMRISQGPASASTLFITTGFALFCFSVVYLNSRRDAAGRPIPLLERIKLTHLFVFPALAWLISAPMVFVMDSRIKVFLLGWVTQIVFFIFDLLGLPLQREGNVLILPEGQVGVADACSGIRSMTACIFAGTFLAAVFLDRAWKKWLMVSCAILLAFVTNIFRSIFLTAWAYHYGADAIEGTVHDVTGYAVLGVTCVLLLLLLPIFNYKLPEFNDGQSHPDTDKSASKGPA